MKKRMCLVCGRELGKYQQKYCSTSCRNKMFYDSNKPLTAEEKYIRSRYYSTRDRASKKGLDFNLTQQIISNIISKPCVYCGSFNKIQLDRADNDKGYTSDNVVPACARCNSFKRDYLTYDEMQKVVALLRWKNDNE